MNEVLVNALFFLFGTFAGVRMHLALDRRKEFNQLTNKVYIAFIRQAADLQRGYFGSVNFDSLLVESYISFWRRNAFRKAVTRHDENYQDASSYDPEYGTPIYDKSKIEQLIISNRKLLTFLKPR